MESRRALSSILPAIAVLCAAVVGHWQVVHTWWLHDDWVFLANAAGLIERGADLARWVTYEAYWKLLYPLFGLDPTGWGVSRLLLHAAASWLVVRIGRHAGLGGSPALLGGLIFAASPVAFESLYWGTGAIELLGGLWALWSLERWLAGGRRNRLLALLLYAVAVASKESGALLAVAFAADLGRERRRDRRLWIALAAVLLFAVAVLVRVKVDVTGLAEYRLSLVDIPRNLLILGFWLVAPPRWQGGFEWMSAGPLVIGGGVWLAWLGLAGWRWRRGDRFWAIALALTWIPLLPATLVGDHVLPRYAYAAVAGPSLCAARLVARRFARPPAWALALAALLAAGAGWAGTDSMLNRRHDGGRPFHRLVLKEELSRRTCEGIRRLSRHEFDHLVFLIDPAGNRVESELLRDAIGGDLGPRLLLGEGVQVEWVDELTPAQQGALVVSVTGLNLKTRGYYGQ